MGVGFTWAFRAWLFHGGPHDKHDTSRSSCQNHIHFTHPKRVEAGLLSIQVLQNSRHRVVVVVGVLNGCRPVLLRQEKRNTFGVCVWGGGGITRVQSTQKVPLNRKPWKLFLPRSVCCQTHTQTRESGPKRLVRNSPTNQD